MIISGTAVLLGAGASADAGYPMADGLLAAFADELNTPEFDSVRPQVQRLWALCEAALNRIESGDETANRFPPTRPHLESFLAFIDDVLRPEVQVVASRDYVLPEGQRRELRRLNDAALRAVFSALAISKGATHLLSLFDLEGPGGRGSTIGTLNFDMSLEQAAQDCGHEVFDGFAESDVVSQPPVGWEHPNLGKFWQLSQDKTYTFAGFESCLRDSKRMLKLHGSLGWYVLEEGTGTLGTGRDRRFNLAARHFRVPHEWVWETAPHETPQDLVSGRSLAQRAGIEGVTGKAGVVWLRPYMVFGRSLKTHPDLVSTQLLSEFTKAVHQAATLLVVGYSWSDAHINDLLLSAVSRGASLVDIGLHAGAESLVRFWRARFPTTYRERGRQLFSLGGGAAQVLDSGVASLPSGETWQLDLVSALREHDLPESASVAAQCGAIWSSED